jgi:hypothetical protein
VDLGSYLKRNVVRGFIVSFVSKYLAMLFSQVPRGEGDCVNCGSANEPLAPAKWQFNSRCLKLQDPEAQPQPLPR